MTRPRLLSLAFALVFVSLTAACSGGSGPPTSDVVSKVPWTGNEVLHYMVHDDKGKELGKETLTVETAGATTTLKQIFEAKDRLDQSAVVVDSVTLKPQSSSRDISTPDGDDHIVVTYTESGALIKQGDKQSGLSVPEHSYDNDTSLFIWRSIAFVPGYEGAYTTVITNFRSRQNVTLKVTGREMVKVPAGEFQAWRLEIKTSNAKQVAWFADTPQRPLLKYDNDRNVIFELQTVPK